MWMVCGLCGNGTINCSDKSSNSCNFEISLYCTMEHLDVLEIMYRCRAMCVSTAVQIKGWFPAL
jgi:hypothetical protein